MLNIQSLPKRLVVTVTIILHSLPILAQEAAELQRLRNSYDGAVQRAVKPLTDAYLKDLVKLRDTYARAVRLAEANQVDEEIKLVTAELAALSAVAPVIAGHRTVVLEARATIPANNPNGYRLAADPVLTPPCS